jgi:hypothetical protein
VEKREQQKAPHQGMEQRILGLHQPRRVWLCPAQGTQTWVQANPAQTRGEIVQHREAGHGAGDVGACGERRASRQRPGTPA